MKIQLSKAMLNPWFFVFQQRTILECLFANKTDAWASEFLSALESRKVNPQLVREIRVRAVGLQLEQEETEFVRPVRRLFAGRGPRSAKKGQKNSSEQKKINFIVHIFVNRKIIKSNTEEKKSFLCSNCIATENADN